MLYILCFSLFEVSQARRARHRAPLPQAAPSHKQTFSMRPARNCFCKTKQQSNITLHLNYGSCYTTWLKPATLKIPSLRGYGHKPEHCTHVFAAMCRTFEDAPTCEVTRNEQNTGPNCNVLGTGTTIICI